MTKKIELTKGKFTLIDDTDYEYLNQWRWYAWKNGNAFYAARMEGKRPFRKMILMHREIMKTPNRMVVDHVDMDGLNNTRTNLRNCTSSQNMRNTKVHSNNSSGYKGVYWDKLVGKWHAQISIDYKTIYIGIYDTIEDAARARDEAAKQYHGEFAVLNFPKN